MVHRHPRRNTRLSFAAVQYKTYQRYQSAVSLLLPFLQSCFSMLQIDEGTSEWIELAWSQGKPLTLIGDALSGLHFFWPQTRRQLHLSWRLFKTWKKLEPPSRALPMPSRLASAMLARCIEVGWLRLGALLGLGFHCLLRTGELLHLRICDLHLSSEQGVVNLRLTKTGLRQGACEALPIFDKWLLQVLQTLKTIHAGPHSRKIWDSSAQNFRRHFRLLCQFFQVQHLQFHPYSLRRGGGTFLLQQGVALEHIMLRGRWRSHNVCRIYLQDGLSALAEIQFTSATVSLLHTYNAQFTAPPC